MQVQHSFVRESSRRAMRAAGAPLAAIVLAFCAAAAPARGQSDGFSFLRIEIAGHNVTNTVWKEKYKGWLQIEAVEAGSDAPDARAGSGAAPSGSWQESDKDGRRWTDFAVILHSGRAGAGRLSFGFDDPGALEPLREAQKHKSLIASAELDYYDMESGAFIGKYRLRGIRVLSLEHAPPSACPTYGLTMTFQSVEKI
jgi:hypothetical protein